MPSVQVLWRTVLGVLVAGSAVVLTSCDGSENAGDDDDDDDDDDGISFTVNVTPDNDVPAYSVTWPEVLGAWSNLAWGFAGYNPSDYAIMTFSFYGPPGEGTWTIGPAGTAGAFAPPAVGIGEFEDFATFGPGGSFASESGSLTVTRWEETEPLNYRDGFLTDGTFEAVFVTADTSLEPIELQVDGTFSNLESYELEADDL